MANYTIQVMDKIYVAMRSAGENGLPTGYMCPYGTTATAKKLMDRQIACTDRKLEPVVLDNEPRIGFRISRAAIYRGYGGTNTSMAIEDPRGFEVHISVTNTVMLFSNNLIQDGMIMTPCVWGRDGSQTVLLPINSEPYKEAVANDERRGESISVRNLKPGNRVLLKNGQEAIYYGKVYAHEFTLDYSTLGKGQVIFDHMFQVFDHQHDKAKHELHSCLKHFTGLGMSKILDSSEISPKEIEQTLNDLHQDKQVAYYKKTGNSKHILAFTVDPTLDIKVTEVEHLSKVEDLFITSRAKRQEYAIIEDDGGNKFLASRQNFAIRQISRYSNQAYYMYDFGQVSSIDNYGVWAIYDFDADATKWSLSHKKEISRTSAKRFWVILMRIETQNGIVIDTLI